MSLRGSAGSRNLFFLLIAFLLLSSCVKGKLDITLSEGVQTPEEAPLIPPAQVFDVDIDDNKLVVQGNHLNGVSTVQVVGPNGFDESFSIEEQSASELIAHATSHVAFAVGSLFSLIISDAHGSTTYTITFTLEDGQVTANKLDDMGAGDGDALVYNAALETWEAMPLSGLSFRGTWDADNMGCNEPDLAPGSGDYWVVSNGGTCDLDGFDNWFEGDWAIYNIDAGWQQVVNTSDVVSFNGRQGVVIPEDDDYTWEMIDLSDSTLSDIADIDVAGLQDGQILKWDSVLEVWYAADDEIGDSVSASDIEDGAISDIHVNASADIAQSKIAGLEDDLDDLLARDGTRAMSGNLDMGTNNIVNVGEVDGVNLSDLASTVGDNESDISTNATSIAANASAITSNTNAINDLDTDDITEAGSLYFLESRVLETELAGYTIGTDSAVGPSDDILSAFGKLQAQIDASGSGDGDFLADGSVAMTGDFDADGNELLNIGAVELINSEDNTLSLRLPATGVADYQIVFPSQLGLEGEVLVLNSAGELEWTELDTGEIESGDIAAEAIDNSHVSATAEIAQSKIAGLEDDLNATLLTDGTRSMTNDLNLGTNDIINVGEVDGVNLSDLASTVGDNESDIATNATAITNLESDVSANETAIAAKQDDLAIPDDATQYLDGDGVWQTLDTDAVTEAGRLYFTDERAQDAAVVNATTGSETDQAPSVASIKAYISDEIDGLGEGDLLSDGSVAMNGDFNLNGNNLINAGNIQLIDDSDNAITLRSPNTGVAPYQIVLPSEIGAEDEILALNSSLELVWTPLSTGSVTAVTADLPLESTEGDTPNLTIRQASGSEDGYLSSLDWNTFNNKQDELTLGNLNESTSSVLTITGGDDSIVGSGVGIEVTRADATNSGYLHSDDWNTFNDKQDELGFSGASASEFLDGDQNWRTLATTDIPDLSASKITSDTLDKDRVPAAEGLNTSCADGEVLRSDGTDLGCVASTLMGPWEHSGSDIYYDSGNVGIGTPTPVSKLTVDGTITLHRNTNNAPRLALYSEENELTIENYGNFSDSDIRLRTGGDGTLGSGQDNVIIKSNGNVGVGTSEPNRILHVADSTPTIILERPDNDPDMKKRYINTTTNGSMIFGRFDDDLTPHEQVRIAEDGNVGIGTGAPEAELHVNGDVKVEGMIQPLVPWTTLESYLGSGWSGQYSSNYGGPMAMVDANGIVHFQGYAETGSVDDIFSSLPAEFRPFLAQLELAMCRDGSTRKAAPVYATTAGRLYLYHGTASCSTWVSLAPISWPSAMYHTAP